jgi:hypothetical protein
VIYAPVVVPRNASAAERAQSKDAMADSMRAKFRELGVTRYARAAEA